MFSNSDSSSLKFYDLNFDSKTSEKNDSNFIPKRGTPAIPISQLWRPDCQVLETR